MERMLITDPSTIEKAAAVLARGGVIVYPTDTVYGLGCDATNGAAVQRILEIKKSDPGKALLAMVSDRTMLEVYAKVTPLGKMLAEQFLPGPLSLILESQSDDLAPVQSDDGSVGFRMPDHAFCLELTRTFGKPITSTSMNRSGFPQPRSLEGMLKQIGEGTLHIDLVIGAGTLPSSKPSTIVDVRGARLKILREGAVRTDVLADTLKECSHAT